MIKLADLGDVKLLALLIAGESDDQPIAGKVAVACVPGERLRRGRWGDTLRAVMLQPYQFSTFNDTGEIGPEDDHWQRFIQRVGYYRMLSQLAIGGLLRSPVPGATHYHRWDVDPKPRWTRPQYSQELGRIDDHIFYREV